MKPQLDNGFIQIATGNEQNDILSALISANLTATEYQVVLTVIRKTWGWKKQEDWISISQFVSLTGKSKRSVIGAASLLVQKNILVKQTALGIKTIYSFNKDFSSWVVQQTALVQKTALVQFTARTGAKDCTGVVQQTAHTKETITKETIQKKTLDDFIVLLDWWNTKYQTSYRTNPPNKKYFEIFSRWIENGGTIEDIKAAKTLAEHNPRWGKGIGIDSLLRSGKTRDADWVEHFINFEGYRDQAKEFQQEYLKKRSNDHQS